MRLSIAASTVCLAIVLSSSACGRSRTAVAPAPSGAPAEVRALDFVVGDYAWTDEDWSDGPEAASSKSNGSLRCQWNVAGAGVDCIERVDLGGTTKRGELAIRWDVGARLYRLEMSSEGKKVSATGQLGDGRLVFTAADGASRTTLERTADGLRLLAESCRKGVCQTFTELELEPPFVAPPNDRNG